MRKKILLIDCFDSFTFNLKHYLEQFSDVDVKRIDKLEVSILTIYDAIVLSPGPKLPSDYPKLNLILSKVATEIPILGVCLGMQAIGEYFGGRLINLKYVKHGLSEPLFEINELEIGSLYKNLGPDVLVARYHSWVIQDSECIDSKFIVTSRSEEGNIMSFKHKTLPIYGVQYHPESIMTPKGLQIIENWVSTI